MSQNSIDEDHVSYGSALYTLYQVELLVVRLLVLLGLLLLEFLLLEFLLLMRK